MKRANTVKRTGTFEAARKRMPRICALVLVCLPVPSVLAAQTEADRESVNEVLESLFFAPSGTEIPYSPGAWSLVFARFAEGDSREVLIPAKEGEEYLVAGAAESFRADVDICVYDPAGDPVDCDTLPDYLPVVGFTAKMEGTYRAVMTAASVEGGGTAFAGMMVVKVVPDRGAEGSGPRLPHHRELHHHGLLVCGKLSFNLRTWNSEEPILNTGTRFLSLGQRVSEHDNPQHGIRTGGPAW